MARRSSGWTAIKAIARAIDQSNKAVQRAKISAYNAQLKEQNAKMRELEKSESQRLKNSSDLTKKAEALQEKFNKAVNAADISTSLEQKQRKITEAKHYMSQLKRLEAANPNLITITNLRSVEYGLERINSELTALKESALHAQTLEKSAVEETEHAHKVRHEINNLFLNHIVLTKSLFLSLSLDKEYDVTELLMNYKIPIVFNKNIESELQQDMSVLALNYALPSIEVIPTLKEAKLIKKSREIKKSYITKKEQSELYDHLLYSLTFLCIHLIFLADTSKKIQLIIFNGWVANLDKSTGHEVNRCVLSLSIKREEYESLNLMQVDVRETFKKFRGISNTKLIDLVAVAPIIQLQRNDRRFVQSYNVAHTITEENNLATLPWEDFEHLVREIFEREFANNQAEVRVTQASRDGGVDAIIFDSEPIRGGKIVVQAKRYTNTVGVSAVRDLYGTLINEGAMKGILITTSDFGPDAFNFAKDKPITLMSGANLLYLLEKHGKKARIDLEEAKKIIAANAHA